MLFGRMNGVGKHLGFGNKHFEVRKEEVAGGNFGGGNVGGVVYLRNLKRNIITQHVLVQALHSSNN